jgi:hypothetical protein
MGDESGGYVGYRTVGFNQERETLVGSVSGDPSMLLRELPSKVSERVRRSVTWAELEGAAPGRTRLRRVLARFSHRGWSALSLGAAVMWPRKRSER